MKSGMLVTMYLVTAIMTISLTMSCGGLGADDEFELISDPADGGYCEVSPDPIYPDSKLYVAGTEVTLTAVPMHEWEFFAWVGDLNGSQNPVVIIMDKDKTITAMFLRLHHLTTSVTGQGSITIDPEKELYSVTDTIVGTATPASDWALDHWEGVADGSQNPLEFSIDQDSTLSAVFVYVDSTVPVINRIGNATVYVAAGSTYTDAGATATDDIDGDITANIITTNPVDTDVPGTYTVSYDVTDSSGNAAVTINREVVVDGSAPVITLIGEPSYTIAVDEDWTEVGTTAVDDVDGDISSNVWSNYGYFFTPRDPGTYIFEYHVSDRAGNEADVVTREIIAIDTTPPVISLSGASTILMEMGTPYTDDGATAEDNVDGDITADIVVENPVDTDTVGIYTVTYNVEDAAGNEADQVTRQVEVVFFESLVDAGLAENDFGADIAEDSSGAYVITGTTYAGGIYPNDMWVLGLDSSGDPVWDEQYGSFKSDAGTSVCATSDGGSVFVGYATIGSIRETWVKKHTSNGQLEWELELSGNYTATGNSIIEDSSGNLLIAGDTRDETGASDLWVIKLDSTGTTLWEMNYGGESSDTGYDIFQCADGSYVVVGATMSFGAGSFDAWVVRIDESGDQLEAWSFGGFGEEYAYSVVETTGGSFVFAGTTNSVGAGGTDAWIVSVNPSGTAVAEATFGGGDNDSANGIIQRASGELVFIGKRTYSFDDKLWIVALDSSLNQSWERTFFRWPDAEGSSIIETDDGYLAAVGSVRYGGGGDWDIWCIKF